jgi:CRISPR-associated protein Cas1
MHDLHALPKVRDSWSYLYVEHCKIDQDAKAIALHDESGKTAIPCAALTTLLLGPGTSVTHAAIRALAENGCLVLWTGEDGVRMYAQGMGETRGAARLLHQARLFADPVAHHNVVMSMYRVRFPEHIPPDLTLQQLRGMEGVRVRDSYARASRDSGVPWTGRSYRRDDWANADPVNRALSAANSCLYGICHAAIVSAGYSPGLGFIHTGKMLSFVYDIADLYKASISIPIAFEQTAQGTERLESRVRHACRDRFHQERVPERIIPDIDRVLQGGEDGDPLFDAELAAPGGLWDPKTGVFVGRISAAVRDRLWKKVCDGAGNGGAILLHQAATEQGFVLRVNGGSSRLVRDFEGLQLITTPLRAPKPAEAE